MTFFKFVFLIFFSFQTTLLKTREKQLQRDLEEVKETKNSLEEDLMKLRTQKSVDDVQTKELQDTLEAEQYFSVRFFIIFKFKMIWIDFYIFIDFV